MLATQIDGLLKSLTSANDRKQPRQRDSQQCRDEFAEYGRLMCEADAAGWPSDTQEKLSKCRILLATQKRRHAGNPCRLVLQPIRFVIGCLITLGGPFILFFLSPFHLLNPVLRKFGVLRRYFPMSIAEKLYAEAVLSGKGWGLRPDGLACCSHALTSTLICSAGM